MSNTKNKYAIGDYVIIEIHGSMLQPAYISGIDGEYYNVDVCLLSTDNKYIEKYPYKRVAEEMLYPVILKEKRKTDTKKLNGDESSGNN